MLRSRSLVLILFILGPLLGLTVVTPAEACLMADRIRVMMPHLSMEEAEKMAHGEHERIHYDVALRGATDCVDGLAGEFSCRNIDLLGHLSLSELGGGEGADIWGWTDEDTGKEYALLGRNNGTSFVDISDPTAPLYLGNLPTNSASVRVWRDVKTYKNFAYIVADRVAGHGMQVFDLHKLRTENLCSTLPCAFVADGVYDNFGSAHNMVINEESGFGYVVGIHVPDGGTTCAGGLHMVDLEVGPISRPPIDTPIFKGCFAADGYTHDAQCVTYSGPDLEHLGKEICFAANEDTVTIVDMNVTGPDTVGPPQQLSRTGYTNPGYTHQGWLTDDQRFFVFDDELDEIQGTTTTKTLVMDVSDLDSPVLAGTYESAGISIDHNQYVMNGYTYQANYERGLRVLKLINPGLAIMNEVAFFDSYPEADSVGFGSFRGAWSVYPFFASGSVIVSDINRGLFVFRVNLPEPPTPVFLDDFETGDTAAWLPPPAP